MIDAHAHVTSAARAKRNRDAGGPAVLNESIGIEQILADQPWPMPVVLIESDRPEPGENERLIDIARETPLVAGVIGRLGFGDDTASTELTALLEHPAADTWRGARLSLLPAHDDRWSPDARAVATAFSETGRTLELLAGPGELREAASIAADVACSVVLDHLGLPPWRGTDHEWEHWRDGLRAVAERPVVSCKFSGIPSPSDRDAEPRAREAIDLALELFGPARLLYASNMPWPPSYDDETDRYPVAWALAVAGTLSDDDAANLLAHTCIRAYGLENFSDR